MKKHPAVLVFLILAVSVALVGALGQGGGERPSTGGAASDDGAPPQLGVAGGRGSAPRHGESFRHAANEAPSHDHAIDADAPPAVSNAGDAGEAWLARFKETGVLFWHDPDGLWTISWHAGLGSLQVYLWAAQPITVEAAAGDASQYNQSAPNTLELAPATDSLGGVIQFRVDDDLQADVLIDGEWRRDKVLVGSVGLRMDHGPFVLRVSEATLEVVRQQSEPSKQGTSASLGGPASHFATTPTASQGGGGGSGKVGPARDDRRVRP